MKVGGSILKRIGIYFFCVIALGCVTSSILYQKSEDGSKIRLEKAVSEKESSEIQVETQEVVLEVSEGGVLEQRFLVKEEDGYLVIYDRLAMKRYDETTILFQNLPERLQEKIAEGLYFADEEELYAFLENYSS